MRTLASGALFLLLASPARASEAFGDGVYYVGDLHAHTGYSGDGGSADLGDCEGTCGNVAELFTTARDNGLEFLAVPDHVNGNAAASAPDYALLNAAVVAADDPAGGFVTIPAAELWFTMRGTGDKLGHKTLLLFGDDATVAGLTLADVRISAATAVGACDEIWDWMADLEASFGNALLVPHHPAAIMPMPTDWSCHSDTWEPSVEVYSEHGNSLVDDGYDPPSSGIDDDGLVHTALDPDGYGLMFGFVGGTDSHDTFPGEVCALDTEQPTQLYAGGLTMAVLDPSESFSREALYDAIVERRTYATSGPVLPMDVRWSVLGVELGTLGEDLDVPESLDLDASVSFPADRAGYVTGVRVVGPDGDWSLADDGAGAWSGSVPAGDVPEWLYVAVEIDGAAWSAAEGGCDDGGEDAVEWLWGSPSPITLWEDDTDGDGESVLSGDCDDGDATINPAAAETWYDGVDQDCDEADDFDQDADGAEASPWGADCADTDATIHPGAAETWYDGVDTDCDLADDFDQDADGHDAPVAGGDDCDDTDADSYPGAAEIWYDGIDQDCDGGDTDADADGFDGESAGGNDCDDANPAAYPGATEIWYDGADEACDGGDDFDRDLDGYDAAEAGGPDCDDLDADVSPDAVESWYDGVDQDCDGASDWDADGDGYDTSAWGGLDCDDADPGVSPGNAETWYDGVDQDCDPSTEYDADGDGFSVPVDCDDADPRAWTCDPVSQPEKRGCDTGEGAPGLVLIGLAAGMVQRRRK